jgi:hypothetical protein
MRKLRFSRSLRLVRTSSNRREQEGREFPQRKKYITNVNNFYDKNSFC